jgi:hypothetical protein
VKRVFDRTVQVLVWGVALAVAWGLVGKTAWAATRSLLDAGPGYVNALEPLGFFLGTLLVAVPGTLLVQRTHSALKARSASMREGAATTMEVTATATRRRILTGRTLADLPQEPTTP